MEISRAAVAAAVAAAVMVGGAVEVDFNSPDLTKLAPGSVKVLKPGAITLVENGKAKMPIVVRGKGKRNRSGVWYFGATPSATAAAQWLADAIEEMTGAEMPIVFVEAGKPVPPGPALYVGEEFAAAAGIKVAGLKGPSLYDFGTPADRRVTDATDEHFRVVSKDGSVYFAGKADFAIYDFAERVLGVREYWGSTEGGRSVVKTDRIVLPEIDYSDKPVFKRREFWPHFQDEYGSVWRSGNSHETRFDSHVPYTWWKDTNTNYAVTRPEIFELTSEGKRPMGPMLCYSNPKTLETYIERIEAHIDGEMKSGGICVPERKTVIVTQADSDIMCQCEGCRKLYDESMGPSGNASRIIWGHFTRRLSDYMAKAHPGWTVAFVPYLNDCEVPKDLTFPAKNAEAKLCIMPGLAMLRGPETRSKWMSLIREWKRATGRPIMTCEYLCWPSEWCSAPYLFGHVAQDYLRDLKGDIVGSFVNGGPRRSRLPERLSLSIYIWMRALWNPEFDVEKVYDVFAERMFGAGAAPMRKLIAMQEAGWMRPWGSESLSAKNIHEISYPRKDVAEMRRLFAEAKRLAAGDALSLKRIEWYEQGFLAFFKESDDMASSAALEPTRIQKVATNPVVDGKLDDAVWAKATPYRFIPGRDKNVKELTFPTELRLVWTPHGGITIGYRCVEPLAGDEEIRKRIRAKAACEMLDMFLDVSGKGDGHYCQVFMDDAAEALYYTDEGKWAVDGIKQATWFGKGEWSAEIYIPFEAIAKFPGADYPTGTSSEGKYWLGNFHRRHMWDIALPKEQQRPCAKMEISRRYTRYTYWNKDPAAFGKLMFVE